MAKKKIPKYKPVKIKGRRYYRRRLGDADGKRVAYYGKTAEELHAKVEEAERRIAEARFHAEYPTVKEYCDKWLYMHSAIVRPQTLAGYESKIQNYIVKPLGEMLMANVTSDDLKVLMVPASAKSESLYRNVSMLVKAIFTSAYDSHIIDDNPADGLSGKGGKPKNEKEALTDEQVAQLLDVIKDGPPYVFVMIALYTGLRREEILGLRWDSICLNTDTPYLSVKRAWRTERNRPVVEEELKTKASKREVPIPDCLAECLREAKECSTSEYVIANKAGEALTYTQFRNMWKYIDRRTTKERTYTRYSNGEKIVHQVVPVLGKKAAHNSLVYSLDFTVTPHQLRYTYITNLISASVDPKTVQHLAGHKNSKITMDIYARLKYNRPKELFAAVNKAFKQVSVTKE